MVVPSKTNKDGICTASFHLFILFILVNFVTSTARNDDTFTPYCSGGHETTPNSVFQRNLKTLFSYLSSNATANKEFYNATVTDINNSNTVYGLFMCNGDVPAHLCSQCVLHATSYNLSSYPYSDCSLSKEVRIRNDDCMVRYSNNSFFNVDFSFLSGSCSPVISVSNQAIVKHLVSETLNGVADEAANSLIGVKKYATKEVRVSEFQTLYFQAQCMPNLTPQDCRKCLNATITNYVQNCGTETNTAPIILGSSESYSCYIRNDVYPFYHPSNAPYPQELIPGSNTIHSKYSQQPSYLSHNCSNNDTLNYDYQSHLKTLFSSMSLNAIKTIFFNKTVDTVHGLFMCRGDISLSPTLCQLCVQDATKRILSECPSSKEAVIWYDKCLLRYSYHSLISDINTAAPKFHQFNMRNNSRFNMLQSFTTWKLADILSELSHLKTGDSSIKNYETRSEKLNDHQTVYTLAQCTPDQSDKTCGHCLRTIFENEIPWNSLARPEGRILYQSCYMMFGLSQFYNNGDEPEELGQVNPPPTKENEKRKSRTIIIVVLTTLSTFLLTLSCYLLRKRARKSSYNTLILKKNFGLESTTLKGLQFEMTEIKTSTNNFSHENKIGEGGFGQVYKGILSDGRHVAVKRLSSSSNQGIVEFKNEILLIAKLQQRNLVALIGFCLEDQEKILIYEYVPNGSLDSFLFDTQQQCLSWNARYKIIGGTALGILYLHEYSRLKVIHRDLKPSNVLLDENMNPKISDFGMARMVQINQDGGQTNKIAGTWGYMSPEYVMFGQFSEKSDVFSFGVIVLEIITGKRNVSPYDPHHVAEGLTSYVWRRWINETPLTILDSKIENYSLIEVIKCVQIGLLCVQENPNVRPTMSAVVSYLNSHSPELPSPQEPAFFIHSRMNQEVTSQMESSSANNFVSYSVNEMSISELYPRQ